MYMTLSHQHEVVKTIGEKNNQYCINLLYYMHTSCTVLFSICILKGHLHVEPFSAITKIAIAWQHSDKNMRF